MTGNWGCDIVQVMTWVNADSLARPLGVALSTMMDGVLCQLLSYWAIVQTDRRLDY